jgi:hypothetical protein
MASVSEQNRGRRRPRTWLLWLAITAALLALNYWAGSRPTHSGEDEAYAAAGLPEPSGLEADA